MEQDPANDLFQSARQAQIAGDTEQAIRLTEQAIRLRPGRAHYFRSLARLLLGDGKIDLAVAAARRATQLEPNDPEGFFLLGMALTDKRQTQEAISAYRLAVELKPDYLQAHANLGQLLAAADDFDAAALAFSTAITLRPEAAEIHNNLGLALMELQRTDDAAAEFEKAISLQADFADAHWNLALLNLSLGRFEAGCRGYEWRFKCKDWTGPNIPPARELSHPRWNGEPLEGKTILLLREQGFGDTIQFIRYAALLAERGATVIAACPPELRRLIQTVPGVSAVVMPGELVPPFDIHCPLLSLPLMFNTTLQTIPAPQRYVRAPADVVEPWRERLAAYSGKLNVGLVWSGTPKHRNDRRRSTRLANLSSWADLDGVVFHSLQKEAAEAGFPVVDWSGQLSDFAQTAGLIENLDLVISVDTAAAHLAGAMGKPVWVMLPKTPDWRWMFDRNDSPWYPTMRLFRQTQAGNWDLPVSQIRASLLDRAARR